MNREGERGRERIKGEVSQIRSRCDEIQRECRNGKIMRGDAKRKLQLSDDEMKRKNKGREGERGIILKNSK